MCVCSDLTDRDERLEALHHLLGRLPELNHAVFERLVFHLARYLTHGYRDQIVTCDVGVSLHYKTHPLFMKYSNGTSTQCYAYHLFPVLFLQSLYVSF